MTDEASFALLLALAFFTAEALAKAVEAERRYSG